MSFILSRFLFNSNKSSLLNGTCLLRSAACPAMAPKTRGKSCPNFTTTSQRRSTEAVCLVLLTQPIARFTAMIIGRRSRVWYKNVKPEDRTGYIAQRKKWVYWSLSGYYLSLGALFFSHQEETPITRRKRFVLFSTKQYQVLSDMLFKVLMTEYKDKLLGRHHPNTQRVERVFRRLLTANLWLGEEEWVISVIEAPDIVNAVVVSNQIVVFTGILTVCSNDDQLAVLLSHELSHTLLNHGVEKMSYYYLLGWSTLPFLALIWAVVPTIPKAALTHLFCNTIVNVVANLPRSRQLETESDEVGLLLVAKACFDVNEAITFWLKLDAAQKRSLQLPPDSDLLRNLEVLSSHPDSRRRADHMALILPEALRLREKSGCPPVSPPVNSPVNTFIRLFRGHF